MFRKKIKESPKDKLEDFHYESGRIVLAPPCDKHWEEWAVLRESSRKFLTPWEPTWPDNILTKDFYQKWVKDHRADWHAGLAYGFSIFHGKSRALMGGVNLNHVRRGVLSNASLGYWMGEAYAGQGYMQEAAQAALEFAFGPLSLHRLEAACLPSNHPSRAVLARCDFIQIGYAEQYMRINGVWEDHVLFELLSPKARSS